MNVLVFSLYISLFFIIISFLDFMSRIAVIWISSPELSYVCHIYAMPICAPEPGRVPQSVGHLTRKAGVLGSIPGLATYFRFSFRFFKKGSCQLLAKVCARSTG